MIEEAGEQTAGRPEAVPGRAAVPGRRRTSLGDRAFTAVALALGLAFGVPIVTLVVRAVVDGSLASQIGARAVLDALSLSFVTTTISLAVTIVLGLPVATLLARRSFPGSTILEAIVDLPIVLPPAVAGLALLLVFGRTGVLGPALSSLGVELPFTTVAVILAQTFVSAPFFIRSARTGIAAVPRDVEDAARVDGAPEPLVFRTVTLPLAAPSLAAGLVMTWARSLGEFGATIMFAGNVEGRTQTLPLVVYSEFQGGGLDASIAAGAVLAVAAFGVLVAVRVLHLGRALDLRSLY